MSDNTPVQVQRRRQLAEALRGKSPKGFRWDFRTILSVDECGTVGCALGWAAMLWSELLAYEDSLVSDEDIGEFFGMSEDQVDDIFYGWRGRYKAKNPRPATVAKALDALGDGVLPYIEE